MLYSSSAYLWDKAKRQYKAELSIDECEPGMETCSAVYNNMGVVILPENTVLDMNIINGLKKLKVEKIKVYIRNENDLTESTKIFKEKYLENLNIVKDVLQELYSGKPLNMAKVNIVADSVLEYDGKIEDIMKNIKHISDIDEYIYTHCLNVSMLSMLISRWLKFNDKRTEMIIKAGLLHDIGKIKISSEIINKPKPLLLNEFEEIKKHSIFGNKLAVDIPEIENEISMGILMHHEREDGSGYPNGLKGDEIHEFAKIIGIADVFDAMTTNKVYRNSVSPFDVFGYLENEGLKKFNKRILMTFLDNASDYLRGEKFLLNTNEIGEIVYINAEAYAKPIIKIGDRFVDLNKNPEIIIVAFA